MRKNFIRFISFVFLSLAFCGAGAQTIDHIAGNGLYIAVPASWSAAAQDGVPALGAQLSSPLSVATDAEGNVYIGDQNWHRIRKVDTKTGLITTVAGSASVNGPTGGSYGGDGGQAVSASLNRPYGVTIAPSGDIYIAEFTGCRVRRVSKSTGIISTVAGTGTNAIGGDGGLATAADVGQLQRVAVDGDGNIYIPGGNRIRKVDGTTGTITTIAGNGTAASSGDGGPAISAEVSPNRGIRVDRSGNIYFTESARIRKIDNNGIISTIAGNGTSGFSGDGGPATSAELSAVDLDIDPAGNIFVITGDYRLRRVDAATGVITTISGTGSRACNGDGGLASAAALCTLEGMSLDADGNIYLVSSRSTSTLTCGNCVRKIAAPSSITTSPDSYGPFCISSGAGSAVFGVSFTKTGSFTGMFKVQISDASGTFPAGTAANIIGTGSVSPVMASIPAGTSPGNLYRVRVLNDNPVIYGNDNGTDITVEAGPVPPVITPAGPVINACAGDSVTLSVTSNASRNYKWQHNGTDIPGAASYFLSAAAAGKYNVLVNEAAMPLCSVSSDTVELHNSPRPRPVVYVNGNVLNTGVYSSYQWYRNDTLIPGAVSRLYTAVISGDYKVKVTDANSCAGESESLMFWPSGIASLPAGDEVYIYPNPVSDIVYIASPVRVDVTITGMDGRKLLFAPDASGIPVGHLSEGIYMMNIKTQDGTMIRNVRLLKTAR